MKSVSLIASSTGNSSITPVPEGLHVGALVAIYDMGTIYSEVYEKRNRKMVMAFELPEVEPIEVDRDGKKVKLPRVITKRFTRSLHEKSGLLAFINAWRGKKLSAEEALSFDLSTLMGKSGQLQVMHEDKNGKTNAKINTILPMPRGAVVTTTSPKFMFSVDQLESPDELNQVDLPKWIKEEVSQSEEYARLLSRKGAAPSLAQKIAKQSEAETGTQPEKEDDVPF